MSNNRMLLLSEDDCNPGIKARWNVMLCVTLDKSVTKM